MKFLRVLSLLAILCVGFMTNTTVQMAKVINDPGRCDFKSRGKTTIVADSNGNDRLLVCVRNNGEFTWKTLSNSFPSLGEYFDPAQDCSQIAQKSSDVKDGFYWIKTTGSQIVRKVWCDVTTDGGGFMLVGHKDSPESWTLPSYPSVVAPDGKPHWSSVLGNASMVEFRIQISVTKSPKQPSADWVYRFKNTRLLKELFMDKQGCTNNYPGIGNIEYVKDLLAGKIVNKKFNCSRFGPSYPSNLGWKRMNRCLGQRCGKGYAIIPGFVDIRYDHYGSYSYSASSQTSGMSHSSTAFIGCDNGKCCACFGPKGATGNFCSPKCGSINGGTVTEKAHAWFWVRSSVPKQPFLKKCMEYNVKTEQGNVETHFIDAKTGILKKGSCRKKGVASLVDGIVQVASKAELEKVPLVKGLMSYREDNEKLYLTNGRSWQALGKQKQIEHLVNSVAQLKTGKTQLNTVVTQLKAANAELQKKVNVLEEKHLHLMRSCSDLYKTGTRTDGVYTINPDDLGVFKVRCDMTTGGGGWTVFQHRMNGTVDFYRGWSDYKAGFGDISGEFWLGLDKINRLSQSGQNVLRVDLEDFSGGKAYAQYTTFAVSNEANQYILTVGGFSGNAGDSLNYHNGMKFSTKYRDNDQYGGNCAVTCKGAWWYKSCYHSNLNGLYKSDSRSTSVSDTVRWSRWRSSPYSLKKTEMKIRSRSF